MATNASERYYNYMPNESSAVKIWTNYKLHIHIKDILDMPPFSAKIMTSSKKSNDQSQKSKGTSAMLENDMRERNFAPQDWEAMMTLISDCKEAAQDRELTSVSKAYESMGISLLSLKAMCTKLMDRDAIPPEYTILNRAPEAVTLADIIDAVMSEPIARRTRAATLPKPEYGAKPMPSVLLKFLLAILAFTHAPKTKPVAVSPAEMKELLTSPATAGQRFVVQLMQWAAESVNSETDVERSVGGALRGFFTNPDWITTSNLEMAGPPAIGMGSTHPRPDYRASIKVTGPFDIPIFLTVSLGEAKNEYSNKTKQSKAPSISRGHVQIGASCLPTAFLLALASIKKKKKAQDNVVMIPDPDDYILGVIYTSHAIAIDVVLPLWAPELSGPGGKWNIYRSQVHTFDIRPKIEQEDWERTLWKKTVRIASVLEVVKQHNMRLARRLTKVKWDPVLSHALASWQERSDAPTGIGKQYYAALKGGDKVDFDNMAKELGLEVPEM